MAQIILTIPDAQLSRVVSDICGLFGYQATIPSPVSGLPDVPNEETPAQFAKRMLVQQVKTWVKTYEMQQAAIAAGPGADQVAVS